MSSSADDIQNPSGALIARLRFTPTPPIEQVDEDAKENIERGLLWSRPVDLYGSCVAAAVAFTWTYMAFAVCPQGRMWEVTRIGVFAADPSTILAGVNAVAFKGTYVPQDGNVLSGQLVDPVAFQGQVPNTSYPGIRGIILHPGERIIIGLKGLANSQGVMGSIGVIDRDMRAFLATL